MIIVQLTGGLGNQMFQYAAGRSLALAKGVALKLDISALASPGPGEQTRRDYSLGCFALPAGMASRAEVEALLHPLGRGLAGRLLARVERLRPRHARRLYHFEHPGLFDPNFFRAGRNVYLAGYWQSEKYFNRYEEILRGDFQVKRALAGENARLAELARGMESVSLHVRRQDYVTNAQHSRTHGTCPTAYYDAAMALVRQRVASPVYFVFSDDMAWCRANLRFAGPAHFVEHNPGDRAYEDLRLMSLCKHHIVANSSFSWWGAWLNPNREKIVIAPWKWFRDYTRASRDLVPEGWERI